MFNINEAKTGTRGPRIPGKPGAWAKAPRITKTAPTVGKTLQAIQFLGTEGSTVIVNLDILSDFQHTNKLTIFRNLLGLQDLRYISNLKTPGRDDVDPKLLSEIGYSSWEEKQKERSTISDCDVCSTDPRTKETVRPHTDKDGHTLDPKTGVVCKACGGSGIKIKSPPSSNTVYVNELSGAFEQYIRGWIVKYGVGMLDVGDEESVSSTTTSQVRGWPEEIRNAISNISLALEKGEDPSVRYAEEMQMLRQAYSLLYPGIPVGEMNVQDVLKGIMAVKNQDAVWPIMQKLKMPNVKVKEMEARKGGKISKGTIYTSPTDRAASLDMIAGGSGSATRGMELANEMMSDSDDTWNRIYNDILVKYQSMLELMRKAVDDPEWAEKNKDKIPNLRQFKRIQDKYRAIVELGQKNFVPRWYEYDIFARKLEDRRKLRPDLLGIKWSRSVKLADEREVKTGIPYKDPEFFKYVELMHLISNYGLAAIGLGVGRFEKSRRQLNLDKVYDTEPKAATPVSMAPREGEAPEAFAVRKSEAEQERAEWQRTHGRSIPDPLKAKGTVGTPGRLGPAAIGTEPPAAPGLKPGKQQTKQSVTRVPKSEIPSSDYTGITEPPTKSSIADIRRRLGKKPTAEELCSKYPVLQNSMFRKYFDKILTENGLSNALKYAKFASHDPILVMKKLSSARVMLHSLTGSESELNGMIGTVIEVIDRDQVIIELDMDDSKRVKFSSNELRVIDGTLCE